MLCGLAAGIAVVAADGFRTGCKIIAVAALVGAVLRLALPEHRAGLLRVRGRAVDVVLLAVLGIGIFLLAVYVPTIAR